MQQATALVVQDQSMSQVHVYHNGAELSNLSPENYEEILRVRWTPLGGRHVG
jgi:hypothetical protein